MSHVLCQVTGFMMNEDIIHKKFNEVCFPTTHNSFNYLIGPKHFIYPNQRYDIPRQLEDGIRAFMIDIHSYNGLNPFLRRDKKVYTFHKFAVLGFQPLSEILSYFSSFLSTHPKEIITIIFDCTIEESARVVGAFESHPIFSFLYHKLANQEWPVLADMIQQNQRLVVLTHCSGSSDWYLNQDQYCFENDYKNHSAEDYHCKIIRGDTSKDLFIMNHFLYNIFNRKKVNSNTNSYSSLMSHSLYCQRKTGHIPNFLSIDWYDKSDLFRVVDELNK